MTKPVGTKPAHLLWHREAMQESLLTYGLGHSPQHPSATPGATPGLKDPGSDATLHGQPCDHPTGVFVGHSRYSHHREGLWLLPPIEPQTVGASQPPWWVLMVLSLGLVPHYSVGSGDMGTHGPRRPLTTPVLSPGLSIHSPWKTLVLNPHSPAQSCQFM